MDEETHATSRMVAGSIPDEVIEVFNCHNPFNRTMALGSTHPLTEMSTRNLPGNKRRHLRPASPRCVSRLSRKCGILEVSQPYGPPWPVSGIILSLYRLSRKELPEETFPQTTDKLHGLSPRANYTDRATAACRRSDCQLLRIKGATWSA
jgi:hypothetical protein